MPLLVLLAVLAACGQPVPAPDAAGASPVMEAARPEGKFVFARAGNIWTWSNGREAQITMSGADAQPRWAPDGSAILFVRNGDSYADLWLIDEAGASPRSLTTNQAALPPDSQAYVANSSLLTGPTWVRTPGGTDTIAFASDRGGGNFALWVAGGPNARPQPVFGTQSLGGNIEGPALSPDGNRIAFVYDTVDPDGGARTPGGTDTIAFASDRGGGNFALWVAGGPDARPQPIFGTQSLGGNIEGPALSPDGNRIAFVYDTVDPDGGARTTQIHVVDLASGEHRPLTTEPGGAYDPAWSPDGRWIAFASRGADGRETNIWVIRPDGSDRRALTDGGADRGPAWSPDGDRLAFVRHQGDGHALFYVDLSASDGNLTAGKAQQVAEYQDIDPASGVGWAR